MRLCIYVYVHNFVGVDNNKVAYDVIYKITYEVAYRIAISYI